MVETPLYLDYFAKLLRLDRKGAVDLVKGYLAEHEDEDVEGLYVDVLMPAMVHTGREWEADRISVAHEHYISEVTRDLIRQLGPRLWADSDAGPVAVATCAPGERHALGLMMVCDILRAGGLRVLTLGEGLPAEAICEFLADTGADLLFLSCGLDLHLPEAGDLIAMARASRPGLVVVAGGAAFGGNPGLAEALGADHFAADAREVRALIPQLTKEGAGR